MQGDIARRQFRLAIVNAANSGLLSGGGVDGAIHRAGGPAILEECRLLRASLEYKAGLPTGEAFITTGGWLPTAHVIHTVGPVWHSGHEGEPELLARCYRNSLHLASEHQLASVAFPGISTGIYGYPKPKAAAIAVRQWLAAHGFPATVIFVAFDEEGWLNVTPTFSWSAVRAIVQRLST